MLRLLQRDKYTESFGPLPLPSPISYCLPFTCHIPNFAGLRILDWSSIAMLVGGSREGVEGLTGFCRCGGLGRVV
jgi:hypothetical protein